MDIVSYIEHPERLDKDTLYMLRELVAKHPYYQAARLLFLQNLFLLHDATFGEEVRRSALLLPDRRVLFNMVEGDNYTIRPQHATSAADEPEEMSRDERMRAVFDNLPVTAAMHGTPAAADAATDYTAFLMQLEDALPPATQQQEQRRQADLVSSYIEQGGGRIELKEEPEYLPDLPSDEAVDEIGDAYLTETMARIYIKQGQYVKAKEIIQRLNLNYPKKNAYFADQIRFLEKLIINNKHNKQ